MQLKDIAPSYMLAFVVALSVFFLKYLPISCWVVLPMQIVVGTTIFLMICETAKMEEYIELKNVVLKVLGKAKSSF